VLVLFLKLSASG